MINHKRVKSDVEFAALHLKTSMQDADVIIDGQEVFDDSYDPKCACDDCAETRARYGVAPI